MTRTRGRYLDYLNPVQLIEFTRFYAAEVADGRYPYVDYDLEDRWHQRIYRDPRLDIWLISWLPEQGTELHDHGGSAGSFTVLSGELTETVVGGGKLHDSSRVAGQSIGFGSRYVHDVRNMSTTAAVSVHAYSPPLTSMTYYDSAFSADGELSPITTLATEDPEPTVELRHAS